ncbi:MULTISPECIES: hypothetical protein [unclassified Leeuwenhoekiella]|uniref:hypothetical protein n=1 Tax=unclassified Leeuwenhoekiella TaxID=2615029 RepID=UPI0025BF307E|nr:MULTISPECIES: hypothetical protein [unclassified Leeuwenhoekiella]
MNGNCIFLLALFLFFLNSPVLVRAMEAHDDLCMIDGIDGEHNCSNLLDLKDSFKKSNNLFDFEIVLAENLQAISASNIETPGLIYLDLISPPPKKD